MSNPKTVDLLGFQLFCTVRSWIIHTWDKVKPGFSINLTKQFLLQQRLKDTL